MFRIATVEEKDQLENELHAKVCAGKMALADAQRCMLLNWVQCWETPWCPDMGQNGLDGANIEVTLDKGRKLAILLSEARKIDLGYASTSHAAQGSTVDRALVNIDSHRSPDLVNERQLYVSLSRARIDARLYTNDAHAMRRAVSREQTKELALNAIKQQPRQSTGIRI